jgi:glycosyltransferase involved in cell wall biosynthesis
MTVWIENPFDNLPPEGFRAQRYWLMARAFADAGHDVVYWTSNFSHSRKKYRELQHEIFGFGFKLKLVPTLEYGENVSFRRMSSHRAYASSWKKMALDYAAQNGNPDVIIVSTPPVSTGSAAIFMKKVFGCVLVVDMMDAWPQTFSRILPRFLRFFAPVLFSPLYRAQRRLYRSADMVSSVCKRYEAIANARAFMVCYHGIDLSTVSANVARDDGRIKLVYAGGLGRTYDLETVVKALAKIPNAVLYIAGIGGKIRSLREFAVKLGCADRLELLGYLSAGALAQTLANADIGIIPMREESFVGMPYKIADYSAAGLAIVSSLPGESRALIESYGSGAFYAADDDLSCVRAIRAVAKNISQCKIASRRMAEECFNASKIYRRFVAFVSQLKRGGAKK